MPYADPEIRREYHRQYCRAWQPQNRAKQAAASARWRLSNPERYLFLIARRRAKVKGIAFEITIADIVIPKYCPILGVELKLRASPGKRQSLKQDSPSLDRIDPSLGYVPGNVQVISWRANNLKSNGTPEEFAAIAAYMNRRKDQ